MEFQPIHTSQIEFMPTIPYNPTAIRPPTNSAIPPIDKAPFNTDRPRIQKPTPKRESWSIESMKEPKEGYQPEANAFNPIGGRKTRKCKNDATFVWLNMWYKNEFEKLGWIILAKNKGDHVKVEAYKNSVKRLYYQLDCKIKDTKDRDRKQDLMIMLKDVKCLLAHIHTNF